MLRRVLKARPAWPGLAVLTIAALALTNVVARGLDGMTVPGDAHTTRVFKGAKVNAGTVTHTMKDGRHVLTWSDDFVIPDTPAPHWQVVDSSGNVYLLQRLKIKDDKLNRTITVPSYVRDIARVQIWCAWAEALLGEASFDRPV
ncbi:MAG: hypothetical protein C4547_10330 [Phycisphaerales bacterium]|nr:MAG: hypothetical protein C4547_10330 [Phycisphaerales bacterium]